MNWRVIFSVVGFVSTSVGADCRALRSDLVGEYIYNEGDTAYEAFALGEDGSFSSWLHGRPESAGIWSYENCEIRIMEPANTVVKLSVIRLSGAELIVQFSNLSKSATFSKIERKEQ